MRTAVLTVFGLLVFAAPLGAQGYTLLNMVEAPPSTSHATAYAFAVQCLNHTEPALEDILWFKADYIIQDETGKAMVGLSRQAPEGYSIILRQDVFTFLPLIIHEVLHLLIGNRFPEMEDHHSFMASLGCDPLTASRPELPL